MPNYGLHRYGRFQYGKYRLTGGGGGTGGGSIGEHVRYRIRTWNTKGKTSAFLTMCRDRVSIPSTQTLRTRIRSPKGNWVYAQNATVQADALKVRIRSIESDGGMSPWAYGVRGNLSE